LDAPTAATTRAVRTPCWVFQRSVARAAAATNEAEEIRALGSFRASKTSPGSGTTRSGEILAGGANRASKSRLKAEARKEWSAVRAPIPLAPEEIGTSSAVASTDRRPRPSRAP